MFSKYKILKDVYRYYAGKEPIGDIWSISK